MRSSGQPDTGLAGPMGTPPARTSKHTGLVVPPKNRKTKHAARWPSWRRIRCRGMDFPSKISGKADSPQPRHFPGHCPAAGRISMSNAKQADAGPAQSAVGRAARGRIPVAAEGGAIADPQGPGENAAPPDDPEHGRRIGEGRVTVPSSRCGHRKDPVRVSAPARGSPARQSRVARPARPASSRAFWQSDSTAGHWSALLPPRGHPRSRQRSA